MPCPRFVRYGGDYKDQHKQPVRAEGPVSVEGPISAEKYALRSLRSLRGEYKDQHKQPARAEGPVSVERPVSAAKCYYPFLLGSKTNMDV